MKVPARISQRLIKETPRFQKILADAKDRDVNESDTVTILCDILEAVFGFDKYTEITREFAIQGTYCDLAVKIDGKVEYLIEVKAIGIDLREAHLRQAVTYAAKQGIRWVVLTTGTNWEIYRVKLSDKVEHERVCAFDFLQLNPKKPSDQEMLYLLCRRGISQDLIEELYEHRKSVNRFMLGAIILSDASIALLRRELRRIKPGLKVDDTEIKEIIQNEVLKRDVTESDTAKETIQKVKRTLAKQKKAVKTPRTAIRQGPEPEAGT